MLERVNYPSDLRRLDLEELEELASEIRDTMIQVVSMNGGHLASNLGVVELTIALHYVFNTPADKIVWDVSHQCYPHKILTGRKDRFPTLRKYEGLSGFCKREESEYDAFNAGHSSTSISAALGIAVGRDLAGRDHKVVAVIGDGSLSGGMAMEGLNQAGHLKRNLVIVLNDNEMSISPNVGAWSGYLKRIIDGQTYTQFSKDVQALIKGIPGIGDQVLKTTRNVVEALKTVLVPGQLLAELGLQYVGPVNGHDLEGLIRVFEDVRGMEGPILLHVVTRKGKGYAPAEREPDKWHGTPAFNVDTGKGLSSSSIPSYTSVFADALEEVGRRDPRVVAISAAMLSGTGLDRFRKSFPDRCFDVGIAEQHAVTFAAGLSTEGFHPVVAVYSTFMQRAFDQVFHDVCLMNLPVVLAMDRAGLVGDDGPTHHGIYDLACFRILPNLVMMAPKDEGELRHMLFTAFSHNGPVTIRYPRGSGIGVPLDIPLHSLPLGKAEVLRTGGDVVLLAIGSMVHPAVQAADLLAQRGLPVGVINARFAKPLDVDLFRHALAGKWVVTLEEGVVCGGFGSAVLEALNEEGIEVRGLLRIGLPDRVLVHGDPKILAARYRLDAPGIADSVEEYLEDKQWQRNESTVSLFKGDLWKRASERRR